MQEGIQNIESLQIINLLCNILNTEEYDQSDYQIAKFLINHLYDLENYSIYEIAEEISVSRSTIRRFCIRMGYENFADLKQTLMEDYNLGILRNLDYKELNEDDYNNLANDLSILATSFSYKKFKSHLETAAYLIKNSKKCTILSTGMQLAFLQGYQVSMATIGKVICLMDINERNEEYLSRHNEDDLIFVISWTGKFLNLMQNQINFSNSKYCLVTFEDTNVNEKEFYKIFRIPKIEGLSGKDIFRLRISYEADISIRYVMPFICNLVSDIYFEISRKELLNEIDS